TLTAPGASPLSTERRDMKKSNQSLHITGHGAIAVSSEILSAKGVSNNDHDFLDVKSGSCDIRHHFTTEQRGQGDMISFCIGQYASGTEPEQRSFSSRITNEHEALEELLIDETAKPVMLSYAVLKDITNNFSEVIGGGGSGEVYMSILKKNLSDIVCGKQGFLRNGKVAVKKLYNMEVFTDKQFSDELKCLIRVKHNNIVRLLGYCSDTQQKLVEYEGQFVLADIRQRFLCIEYAPNKSLADYLKDGSRAHIWATRYQLIDGICQGLHYLHKKESITHLDLKPGNVLLDANMAPKISDFGISRCFSGTRSKIITRSLCGSLGYIAPELLEKGEISFKSDIFSLGIIIRNILSGSTDLSDFESV
ncbi:hypothetical protein EJB05_26797, partial [Eragrostis curvula]